MVDGMERKTAMKPPGLMGLFLCTAALPACVVFDYVSGGGCETEDTVGAEGKVRFDFMQSDEDLSASSGNAFAAGTRASLRIKPASRDETLPPWDLESGDEDILTVEEQEDENEDFPFALSLLEEGEATLEVVGTGDGDTIDRVELKVLEPDGLLVHVSHPVFGSEPADDTIALALGGPGCALDFFPVREVNNSEKVLYGEFEVSCDGEAAGLSLFHEPVSADHESYSITVTAGIADSFDLVFTGPGGHEANLTVLAATADQVDGFDLVFTPRSGDGKHAGDWGFLTGAQYVSGTPLCSGHRVVFSTSDPYIVSLDHEGVPSGALDTVRFQIHTSGVVTLAAVLDSNPYAGEVLEFVVQPHVTY
jgi:hypothetical protein